MAREQATHNHFSRWTFAAWIEPACDFEIEGGLIEKPFSFDMIHLALRRPAAVGLDIPCEITRTDIIPVSMDTV
jgi:hypothetical protein